MQRLSTNEMRLPPGSGTVTILTSPTARIVALLTVQVHRDGLLLITGADQGPTVFMTLRSQIFFSDKVELAGRGAALAQFGVYGPAAGATLARAGAGDLDDLALFSWREVMLADQPCTVQRIEGVGSDGLTVLAPAPVAAAVRSALLDAGAVLLGEDAFTVLRVEAGVPAAGIDLTEQVNPLEAGLRRFCNDFKGCYTGQEIIARQITYDKVTTRLVGLRLSALAVPGAQVLVDGRQVGWISSAVQSVALDQPVALAFVRRPHDQPGTEVTVQSAGAALMAEVAALPFAA
ncbi:MAG: glycine cleavage T C-terminal barrel domain-containing protein [Caldilineales bacterium]